MKLRSSSTIRTAMLIALMLITAIASRLRADTGTCGGASVTLPFTDVMSSPFFCQIAEAYFSGLSNGTSATTYSPGNNVTREQMAAFVTRTMDQSLKRRSRRAVLKQFWTPTSADGLGLTSVGSGPLLVESDGGDVWVASGASDTVSRVRASDGKLLQTWAGATKAYGALAARGMIWVTGNTSPGALYVIDPTQPVAPLAPLTSSLGNLAAGLSFDGARIWTANSGGSVSIVTLDPLSISTVTAGFTNPIGILHDGANMWVTDAGANKLFKLDTNGAILQTVTVAPQPTFPVFDGTNIWVPNSASSTVTVVRASTGTVIATLTGNGLDQPLSAAFDGERILVTNSNNGGSVSLWKAADLSPLGSLSTGGGHGVGPYGACSDGLNFWITLNNSGKLARF